MNQLGKKIVFSPSPLTSSLSSVQILSTNSGHNCRRFQNWLPSKHSIHILRQLDAHPDSIPAFELTTEFAFWPTKKDGTKPREDFSSGSAPLPFLLPVLYDFGKVPFITFL